MGNVYSFDEQKKTKEKKPIKKEPIIDEELKKMHMIFLQR